MTINNLLINLCWIILIGFWIISSKGIKKNVTGNNWWHGVVIRGGIVIFILLLTRIPLIDQYIQSVGTGTVESHNWIGESVGVVVVVSGIALAIWGKVHLGKNWGMPMSIKEKPELVTTGPYAIIRHPIYSGVLLAMLGSALASSILWLGLFVVFLLYFFYSLTQEEKLMTETFPHHYPEYKKRTKALIPFIL